MEKRFGLRFEIFNRDFVTRRRRERGFQVRVWGSHSRFIVSNDPEEDGTDVSHLTDTQIYTGKWQVKLAHTAVGTGREVFGWDAHHRRFSPRDRNQ